MKNRSLIVPLALSLLAGLTVTVAPAEASRSRPVFVATSADRIQPRFSWGISTYAARCKGGDLSLRVRGGSGWKSRLDERKSRGGGYGARFKLDEGQSVRVKFTRKRGGLTKRFWVRCLPEDFPGYSFQRFRSGGPGLFAVGLDGRFATVFNRNGVPIWWYRGIGTMDTKVLADGTIGWNTNTRQIGGDFEIRSLTGRLLRTVGTDENADFHDLQPLPNGNYLFGAFNNYRRGVDASEFGGKSDALTQSTVIQEVTPEGRLVRSWDPADNTGLDETGRWWDVLLSQEGQFWYDVSHWNAVEPDGKFMYLSYRHLDAIYKVNRYTGKVIWKLGGTETPKSLEVLNHPGGDYPFGGQHDVRVQPNGSITVFNNRTGLADSTPRAERFRINDDAGTAKLVESVEDGFVPPLSCCGSSHRLPSKEWLVSWGDSDIVGAYDRAGRTIYWLNAETYRANPVPGGSVSVADLRRAMNRMNR